jgi:hypothetical protein
MTTTKQQRQQHNRKRKAAAKKRNRARAMPSRDAFAFTIPDAQSLGLLPGKTKTYELDKRLKAEGKRLLFKDAAGRTMADGDTLRELVKEAVAA